MPAPALGLLALLLAPPTPPPPSTRALGPDQILEAMRAVQGFDPTATTNGARFQAEVVLRLVRRARTGDARDAPLFLGHEEWFSAFLERTALPPGKAPAYVRLAWEHGQDMEVDYRTDRVVQDIEGAPPDVAANVRLWWPERPGGPKAYSYDDTLSTPHLKVTNQRVLTYRLLDFGDMLVYGEIEGLRGRPTSGVLGFLFRIIGEGHVTESRMGISADGLQVTRARAEKAFLSVTQTVTVYPDGRTEKDLPPNRPDLATLEARLKQPLKVRYRPLGAGR